LTGWLGDALSIETDPFDLAAHAGAQMIAISEAERACDNTL
jgi:hypothetical protein